MQYSFSRVETFKKCPYLYKLKYIDNLDTLPNTDDPANALFIGTALHTAIERGVKAGIKAYYAQYPAITDAHIAEALKIEKLAPLVCKLLPKNCTFEYKLNCADFIGFIDLLVDYGGGNYGIYDFKYSNNVEHYMNSAQLHVYKYFFEQLNPDKKVIDLGFIFVPKTGIRQKKTETVEQFRHRLNETLEGMRIVQAKVKYDPAKVKAYFNDIKDAENATDFPKNESRLCDFCNFNLYCKKGVNYMILPKNERRVIHMGDRKKIWIYGAPYNGKTYLANQFPSPLMLNTDGNIDSFDAPYISIADGYEGRIPVMAWEILKNTIDELAKGSEFKTIVLDLIEDAYEACRRWCYQQYGFDHESDAGFGKGYDITRNEFLSVIKKLSSLPYNIIFISHIDASKDITRKSGDKITAIKPNINEKLANKIAGMVDIVARAVADNGNYTLNFKADDIVFGGGRLKLDVTSIPSTYEALNELYEKQTQAGNVGQAQPQPKKETSEATAKIDDAGKQSKSDNASPESDGGNSISDGASDNKTADKQPKTTTRRRRRRTETV